MSKIYFVGGYYNTGKFTDGTGEIEHGFYPHTEVAIYDVESVMKLGFVEPASEDYEDRLREDEDAEWDELSENEKAKFIMDYVEMDEIAGLNLCESLEKANAVLKSKLDDMRIVEEEYEATGQEQNEYGQYIDIYTPKKKD